MARAERRKGRKAEWPESRVAIGPWMEFRRAESQPKHLCQPARFFSEIALDY